MCVIYVLWTLISVRFWLKKSVYPQIFENVRFSRLLQMIDKVKEQAGEVFAFEIWSLAVQPEQTVRIGATDADVYSFISRTENGLYQCGLCLKISRDGSNMRRHMMIKHSEPTNEECLQCHRVFPNRFYLARHSKICSVNSWFLKTSLWVLKRKGSLGFFQRPTWKTLILFILLILIGHLWHHMLAHQVHIWNAFGMTLN